MLLRRRGGRRRGGWARAGSRAAAFCTSPLLASLDSVVETVARARPGLVGHLRRRSSPRRRRGRRARRPWSRRARVRRGERAAGWRGAPGRRGSSSREYGRLAAWQPLARLRAGALAAPAGWEERGSSAASALRRRSASPASWSRRCWICSRRRSITVSGSSSSGASDASGRRVNDRPAPRREGRTVGV